VFKLHTQRRGAIDGATIRITEQDLERLRRVVASHGTGRDAAAAGQLATWEAAPSRGRISILAPVGVALLGLSVGQEIEWPLPNGRTASLRIVSVLYQPEAAGELHV
jgi:transcription elongation GreA/GreB family factor